MKNIITKTVSYHGKNLDLVFGKYAPQADVSVLGTIGGTTILLTVVVGNEKTEMDYFPLTVEYVEKLYAGGIIKGSRWVKREGKPSDESVLTGRMIDRGIRSLFPKTLRHELQIVATLLSVDEENDPSVLAATLASIAVHLSPLPWGGPLATCRVGYLESENGGEYIVNPSTSQMLESKLDMVVSSTAGRVVMIETGSDDLPDDLVLASIEKAFLANQTMIKVANDLEAEFAIKRTQPKSNMAREDFKQELADKYESSLLDVLQSRIQKAADHKQKMQNLIDTLFEAYAPAYDKKQLSNYLSEAMNKIVRKSTLASGKRVDGRAYDELRPLTIEAHLLPRTHGSGLFARGETQVLSIATLAPSALEQTLEGPEGKTTKRYMHHYAMPPYSVGETGRIGFVSRREVGHGALAEKALLPVLPSVEQFPYAVRVVSEVLSSNGSTSMASTCGSTLALMDAGVPLKKLVAGISVGLMEKSENDYVLLTDIAGIEDFSGDMDFKITGTTDGITAIQLDVKNSGLTMNMIRETFARAATTRLFILEKMQAYLGNEKRSVSAFAPKIVLLTPPEDKIGEIIGPGGKMIRYIIATTGAEVDVLDDNRVSIASVDEAKVKHAVSIIEGIYTPLTVGEIYEGKVSKVLPFGAVVEVAPGKDGLLHVSTLGKGFVDDATKMFSVGQDMKVKVIAVDPSGKVSLADPSYDPSTATEARGQRSGRDFGRDDRRGDRPFGRRGDFQNRRGSFDNRRSHDNRGQRNFESRPNENQHDENTQNAFSSRAQNIQSSQVETNDGLNVDDLF